MKTNAKALSAPETANVLRRALGGVRAWDDTLSDMRIGKQNYHGLTLLPYCRYNDGRGLRPYYLLRDIGNFINDALLANPSSIELRPIQVHDIEIDLKDNRSWRLRKLTGALPVTSPIAARV